MLDKLFIVLYIQFIVDLLCTQKDGIGKVAQLGQGKSFGEIALQGNDQRTATIKALTRCVLFINKFVYIVKSYS